MGVRVVFPDMGKDPSVQLIEKTITENGTYDALTDGANGYSKVNVNVEGGGGESDFSTAQVTVVDSNTGYISSSRYMIPYITENDGVGTTMVHAEDESYDLIVPLYKGKGTFEVIPENIVVSGDANYDENTHAVHIFGNCSIKGWANK